MAHANSTSKGKGRDNKLDEDVAMDAEEEEEEEEEEDEEDIKPKGEQEEDEEDLTPEMMTQRKRGLRASYRTLQGQVEETRQNLIDITVGEMAAQVKQADKLFRDVKAPSEAILDSRVLMAASGAGALKARQLKIDANAFDTDEFLLKLVQFMGGHVGGTGRVRTRNTSGSDEDEEEAEVDLNDKWLKVGRALAPHSLRIPSMDHMWGPLSTEIKEKKQRTQRAQYKADETQRVRPESLDQDDLAKDPLETTKMVSKISTILQNGVGDEGGIPYLQFVVNPESFAQTVENMFYFAFLIREGKAAIEFEENEDSPYYGDAIVYRCEPAGEEEKAAGATKQQLVLEITQEIWRDAIEAYDIKEPLIPTREVPAAQQPGAKKGRWS